MIPSSSDSTLEPAVAAQQNALNFKVIALGASLALVIVLMMLNFWWVGVQERYDKITVYNASELRILTQSIAKNTAGAADGIAEAFLLLRRQRDEFENRLVTLEQGDPKTGLPPSPMVIRDGELKIFRRTWDQVLNLVDTILGRKVAVLTLKEVATNMTELIPKLQMGFEDIVDILLLNGAGADQVAVATRQSWLAERIGRNIDQLMDTGEDSDPIDVAEAFYRDTQQFGHVLGGMLDGDEILGIPRIDDEEVRKRLEEVQRIFGLVSRQSQTIANQSRQLADVRNAASHIFVDSRLLLDVATQLNNAYTQASQSRLINMTSGWILGGFAFVLTALLSYLLYTNAKSRLAVIRSQQKEHQVAILRLLNELADLAHGDLTVRASCNSELTTSIAKSFNFAIDALRKLVATINETAVQVSTTAQDSESIAKELARASSQQTQEIIGVSKSVNNMADSIEQVSKLASESSNVAEQSVQIAHNGVEVVQDTIVGMDTIRARIQETAKRIKRLGESSQEIGDILSLIAGIAEQTNILALNSSIQAAMAGESGQGFASVADEVQQLAERTSDAAKQIEGLVNTIQADTNEAVRSMEQSTAQVVEGAKLAHDAGVALEAIENVSNHLARYIGEISDAASKQSTTAVKIANTMDIIQDITTQTASGVTDTTGALNKLAGLSRILRDSVAGFKLPS